MQNNRETVNVKSKEMSLTKVQIDKSQIGLLLEILCLTRVVLLIFPLSRKLPLSDHI